MGDEKKEPKQIIYASSISVYGEKINLDIYDENIKESPTTPYGITKLESEKFLLKKYQKNHGSSDLHQPIPQIFY